MSLKRDVPLSTALRYKGQGPMLTFILHRLGGSALFIFFTLYILALAGVESVNGVFANPLFQFVILALGLFHAINGLRITILDLWPRLLEHQRGIIQAEWAVLLLVYGFTAFAILRSGMGG
jgi:succinate dehydrogenase / fumarate reductase cytochrome b subunit